MLDIADGLVTAFVTVAFFKQIRRLDKDAATKAQDIYIHHNSVDQAEESR